VYYTAKRRFMGDFVNRRITIVMSLITVAVIIGFNAFLLTTLI
jgi:Mn2+/Fe2+ NRAMP family transporter